MYTVTTAGLTSVDLVSSAYTTARPGAVTSARISWVHRAESAWCVWVQPIIAAGLTVVTIIIVAEEGMAVGRGVRRVEKVKRNGRSKRQTRNTMRANTVRGRRAIIMILILLVIEKYNIVYILCTIY